MKWFARQRVKPNRRTAPAQPVERNWRRPLLAAAGLMTLTAFAYATAQYLDAIEWERFRVLEITGELDRVGADEVRSILQPYMDEGFARIDLRAARAELESLPWVADAAVRRAWPATLIVELREENPVATWFGTALMNADGKVFVDGAAGYSGVLPDVGGPGGSQRAMVERLDAVRASVASADIELRRLLRTERRAERFWIALENGEQVEVRLGRRDIDARLDRFVVVAWPALRDRASGIDYVDMRYTNGFAVGWKTMPQAMRQRERG